MLRFTKQHLPRKELNKAFKADYTGRADPWQKAIVALVCKVKDQARLGNMTALIGDTVLVDKLDIKYIEITEDGSLHVIVMVPIDFSTSEIDEELRPFAIDEEPLSLTSKP